VSDIDLGIFVLLDLRDKVGGGDVDEVAGAKGSRKVTSKRTPRRGR
jgi:hypothetical protein